MGWSKEYFTASIGKKLIMSLSGLFLCFFLISHLSGNLLLFAGDDGLLFNAYSAFMSTNPLIRIVEIILFAAIFGHIIYAAIITIKNKKARKTGYEVSNAGDNSPWYSRWMGFLGMIILIFLVLHIANFFVAARFGDLPSDTNGNHDLFTVVKESFELWWYSLIYVLAMVALAFHLLHGVHSGFRSLGLGHRKYVPIIKGVAVFFALIFPIGFASMPIYFYLNSVL